MHTLNKLKKYLSNGVVIVFGGVLFQPLSYANDEALYDLAPDNASFFRVLNQTGEALNFQVGSKSRMLSNECQFSKYEIITKSTNVLLNNQVYLVEYTPKMSVSLVIKKQGENDYVVHELVDELISKRNKALLSLYNVHSQSVVNLVVNQNNQTIFSNVQPNQVKQVEVNPLKLDLRVDQSTVPQNSHTLNEFRLLSEKNNEIIVCENSIETYQSYVLSDY